MPDRSIKGILELFERQAEDELNLLSDTGVEYFTTSQLLRLRGQWEVKNALFQFFQQITMHVVAVSPIWIVLALLLLWLKWVVLALAIALLFPLSFVFYFLGLWFMQKVFQGRGHLEAIGGLISEELERRRWEKTNGRRDER